jgi:hypothetical protein
MVAGLHYMMEMYVERSSSHGTWNTLQQIKVYNFLAAFLYGCIYII